MLKDSFAALKAIVAGAEADAQKAIGGQKAAATRLRKAMQEVKGAAQQVRLDALAPAPMTQDVADLGKQDAAADLVRTTRLPVEEALHADKQQPADLIDDELPTLEDVRSLRSAIPDGISIEEFISEMRGDD